MADHGKTSSIIRASLSSRGEIVSLQLKVLRLLCCSIPILGVFLLSSAPVYAGYITVSVPASGGYIPNCQSWVNSSAIISSVPDNVVITGVNAWVGGLHWNQPDLEIDLKDGNSTRSAMLWNREGGSWYYGGPLNYSKLVTGITAFNGLPANGTWRLWAYDYSCAYPPGFQYQSSEGLVPAWEMTAFYEVDSDGDGIPDNIDADDDSDGMPDVWETNYGLNPHDPSDANKHKDNDGLTNLEEYRIGTRPDLPDSDVDGMDDGWEVANRLWPTDPNDAAWDNDSDGLTNLQEFLLKTDPNKADTDGDGLPDGHENGYPIILNPLNPFDAALDYEGDRLTNLQEYLNHTDLANPDTDGDDLPDGWEVRYGFNPLSMQGLPYSMQDGASDYDHDGLTAMEEFSLGTNPNNSDTDGDGMPEGWEVNHGLNPLVIDAYLDPDGDGKSNIVEYQQGTNPHGLELPKISVSLSTDDFGKIMLSKSSSSHIFTITNSGTVPLSISSVGITGLNIGDFVLSANTCPSSLSPNSQCNVQVKFAPKKAGSRTANITISTNDPDIPQQNIILTGKGWIDITPILMLLLN